MSDLLENKIDLLIEKVQEELAEISYQLKVANDLKKVEIAHKMKLDIENGTDVDLVKASLLIDDIIGYLECVMNLKIKNGGMNMCDRTLKIGNYTISIKKEELGIVYLFEGDDRLD